MKLNLDKNNQKGMAVLLLVLTMAFAISVLSFGNIFWSLSDLEIGFDKSKGEESFFVADACLEEVMRILNLDETYSGGTLSFSNFSCIIDITSVGSTKNIFISGSSGDFFKKIEATATVSSTSIFLNSWQEVGN